MSLLSTTQRTDGPTQKEWKRVTARAKLERGRLKNVMAVRAAPGLMQVGN